MKLTFLIFLLTNFFTFQSFAKVTITKMDFKKNSQRGIITLHYDGLLNGYPELKINGKEVKVFIPESTISKTLSKSTSFSSASPDTTFKAYKANKSSSELKGIMAYNIQRVKNKVALTIKDNRIELTFPRVKVAIAKKAPVKKVEKVAAKKNNVKKEFLDEKYLNNLLTVKKEEKVESPKKETKDEIEGDVALLDKVSSSQAAPAQPEKKSSISLIEYGGKFVAFLGFVLLLFYGVIVVMKKGFIKKGKLGFLNNADQISVVSQTYIAPKKSLMLIKAHNQVFLVSNTDQGIHPISEIKDAAGLFKAGEKELSGHNFDTNLEEVDIGPTLDTKVNLKKDITKSNQESSLSSYLNVKEKVSFSDQLKKKVKNLKPLQ